MTYSVLESATDATKTHPLIAAPTVDLVNSKVKITVPNTALAKFELWVYAVNAFGSKVFSSKITINVIFDCKLDTITPIADQPTITLPLTKVV